MADIIDVIYRLRNMAAEPIETLRAAIAEAQAVLDKLDSFASDAEHAAEVASSSDRFPTYFPRTPPTTSGLIRPPVTPTENGENTHE